MTLPVDTVEYLEGALVQHGPVNDRIYLMKLGEAAPDEVLEGLLRKASDVGYSKIFAKIPESAAAPFLDAGFRKEAKVPRFFSGRESAAFLGYYLDADRAQEADADRLDDILALTRRKSDTDTAPTPLPGAFSLRPCGENDAPPMADIYREVFPTYPFPIQEPDYLVETMRSHVAYFGITHAESLVALSSSEMDRESKNAEMTDFATLPDWRGHGLATHLLSGMENAMRKRSIRTAYTIARAASPGMNITFARRNYDFGGRLVNNTNISGQIESMNIWYKHL